MSAKGKNSTANTKFFQERLEDLIVQKKKRGTSQNQIAEEIGITPSSLSSYASDSKEAGINSLCKIAKYFGVSTDYLLGMSDNPSTNIKLREITNKYGLTNEALRELANLKKYETLESKAALTFINAMIESLRSGTVSDSTNSLWLLSQTLIAYTINNELNRLYRDDKEEKNKKERKKAKEEEFPVSEPKKTDINFELLDDERYKLLMYFEQFIKYFQDNPVLKKQIEKIYDDDKFIYDDYEGVQYKLKNGFRELDFFEKEYHTSVSHPLAIFFEGIISYERDSNSSPNKAKILPVPKIPIRGERVYSLFDKFSSSMSETSTLEYEII